MAEWKSICTLEEIPRLGSRVVRSTSGNIAVFRTSGGEVFALRDRGARIRAGHVAGPGTWQPGDLPPARLETAPGFRRRPSRLIKAVPVATRSGWKAAPFS